MALSQEEKLRILSDLIRIASADGEHRDEEYDLLHEIARVLKVEPMEMERLFTSSERYPAPAEEPDRIRVFYYLLRMISVDTELVADEVLLLRDLSMHLGLNLQAVDQSLARAHLYRPGTVPEEEVKEIFRVHNN